MDIESIKIRIQLIPLPLPQNTLTEKCPDNVWRHWFISASFYRELSVLVSSSNLSPCQPFLKASVGPRAKGPLFVELHLGER